VPAIVIVIDVELESPSINFDEFDAVLLPTTTPSPFYHDFQNFQFQQHNAG
jgi:hypothetical protein